MKIRRQRLRRPDPLVVLALLVGLGVVVTTGVQAATSAEELKRPDSLPAASAGFAGHPAKAFARRLDLHWLSNALKRSGVDLLLTSQRLDMGKPFGHNGPELDLSWSPGLPAPTLNDSEFGVGAVSTDQPEIYFTLRRSW